jgi:predicted phosphodiesterase
MKFIIGIAAVFILFNGFRPKPYNKLQSSNFEIGILSDCQYCYCDASGKRFYKRSPKRLQEAVGILNKKELKYTIHLGDFIDRDFNSFDTLVPIWNELKSKKYHVLGNHDFSVADSSKSKVLDALNIKDRYYSFLQDNWRFIVLDGNDLSFHGSLTTIKKQQTDSIYDLYKNDSADYLQKWNGALSKEQLHWVRSELEIAKKNNENVGFYCHFPALPFDTYHNLWNRNELTELISEYSWVKLFFNGHNHAGDYEKKDGVHYLTFKGMVNTNDSNSFATVLFTNDSIFINGYGREISRILKLK